MTRNKGSRVPNIMNYYEHYYNLYTPEVLLYPNMYDRLCVSRTKKAPTWLAFMLQVGDSIWYVH